MKDQKDELVSSVARWGSRIIAAAAAVHALKEALKLCLAFAVIGCVQAVTPKSGEARNLYLQGVKGDIVFSPAPVLNLPLEASPLVARLADVASDIENVSPAAMAATVSSSKAPYDPVKAIEGMFGGTVTRIGYIFQEPASFGPSSKTVLGATSKRFQDVLDDCEIQILDAKSYLEHQLALNKARREAKAQEDGLTAKRKLDEMNNSDEAEAHQKAEEREAKRQKVEEKPTESAQNEEPPKAQPEAQELPEEPQQQHVSADTQPSEKPAEESVVGAPKAPFPQPQVVIPKASQDQSTDNRPPTSEGFLKSTPQDTPANDAINFESMFGDAGGDAGDGTGNDLNFDLDLNPDSFGENLNLDNSSLDNLLPGLQTYASQAGQDSGMNFSNLDEAGDNMAGVEGNMELPDLGNSFDDFFNENNLGGGNDGDEMMNDSNFNIDDQLNFFDS